jgi:hypothetical protein
MAVMEGRGREELFETKKQWKPHLSASTAFFIAAAGFGSWDCSQRDTAAGSVVAGYGGPYPVTFAETCFLPFDLLWLRQTPGILLWRFGLQQLLF